MRRSGDGGGAASVLPHPEAAALRFGEVVLCVFIQSVPEAVAPTLADPRNSMFTPVIVPAGSRA